MPEKCDPVQEQLSTWLDGELDPEERRRLSAHLESCPSCRRELARLTALDAALGALKFPVPPDLAARVLARLPRRRAWWQNLALAASLVLGIILGGAVARDLYPLPPENGAATEIASLEAFHDFPQGSLGTVLASYQAEEGNGR